MNEAAQFPAFITFGTVKDHEGNQYKTVEIGHQIWIAENFRATTFRNGDYIPFARGKKEWKVFAQNGTPAWCFYRFDAHFAKMGIIYNWHAANDPRGLAPFGFRVPTLPDWESLLSVADSIDDTYSIAERLKTYNDWTGACSVTNNATGFSAVPAGRIDDTGSAFGLRFSTSWWTSTALSLENAWSWRIEQCVVGRALSHKGSGAYLRLVK